MEGVGVVTATVPAVEDVALVALSAFDVAAMNKVASVMLAQYFIQ